MTNILSALVPVAHAASGGTIQLTQKSGSAFSAIEGLTVGSIISGAISLVMLAVSLIFFFILIMGGLKWVMSEGDQKAVESARNQITNALVGLAIVFAAFAIMKLIGIVFGIDIIGNLTIPTFQ
ncbi:MAG: hypothetical protein WC069_05645 [Candidatus Shapirobacteria bacterium]